MSDRLSRLAPLTGVLFAVMTIVAVFTSGETPKADASAGAVIAYYQAHSSKVELSNIVFALAFTVLVFFAGSLRSYMRRAEKAEGASALVLAGAVIMAVGVALIAGVEFGLAHELSHIQSDEQMVRTLNFLANELFVPTLAGALVFGIASGVAILRGAALPNWLGWVAIVLGIATIVPPASIVGLFGFVVWSLIVSILMYLRSGGDGGVAQTAVPAVAAGA